MSWSRRRFLLAGAAGGGLLIGYGLSLPRDLLGDRSRLPAGPGEVALNAWLKIDTAGAVTVAVPRAEMGQGVYTALPMLVAEELDVDWSQVRVEQAPIEAVYGNVVVLADSAPFDPHDRGFLARSVRWTLRRIARELAVQVTGGSTSVRDAWLPMRTAGAAARDMLVRAAAARLGVEADELVTERGQVIHAPSQRRLGYGALAVEASALDPDVNIAPKARQHWHTLGQPLPRLDIPAKTDGSAAYGIDVRQPGTVYVAIRIAPDVGGRLASFDRTALESQPGVIGIVPMFDALAVAGRTWWHAEHALARAEIGFEPGPHADSSNAGIVSAYEAALDDGEGFAYEDRGNAEDQFKGADVIRASYTVPMLAHACMEPMNCTVRSIEGGVEIWAGNQAPDLLRRIAASRLEVDESRVVIHTPLLGGGFGRRGEPDAMLRALEIAQAIPDQTVQLVYSREQDMQHDVYRPPAMSRFSARLDENGRVQAWHNHIAGPSVSQSVLKRAFPNLPMAGPDKTSVEGAAFLPYAMAHRRVEHSRVDIVPAVGFWRSVGHSYNAFFTESFMDELALAANMDPIAFRLAHLAERPRAHRVLDLVRERSDWATPPPPGRARGVALHESFHSIVAQVAEVGLDNGAIRVHRVVCVIDCGVVVNPDTVIAQMESGIAFGLTAALHGEIAFEGGRVQQRNFPDYRMVTMKDMPVVETYVIDSDSPPGGVGEPGTPPIAPAVANALAALTGVRQRQLPLSSGGS